MVIEFSNELERLLGANNLSRADLSRTSGISEPTLSRWFARKYKADASDVEKVAGLFSKKEAERLVMAYLRDICPADYRHVLDAPHSGKLADSPHKYQTEFERAIAILPQHAERDPDARSIILSMAKMLAPKSDKP